jgi:hypothetical protein
MIKAMRMCDAFLDGIFCNSIVFLKSAEDGFFLMKGPLGSEVPS